MTHTEGFLIVVIGGAALTVVYYLISNWIKKRIKK
jgi:hypothetical protein